jgi:hypothetical protein
MVKNRSERCSETDTQTNTNADVVFIHEEPTFFCPTLFMPLAVAQSKSGLAQDPVGGTHANMHF